MESAESRAEMAPERRAEDLIAAIMGPLFYRRWFSKEPLDERFLDAVVEAAVAAAMR